MTTEEQLRAAIDRNPDDRLAVLAWADCREENRLDYADEIRSISGEPYRPPLVFGGIDLAEGPSRTIWCKIVTGMGWHSAYSPSEAILGAAQMLRHGIEKFEKQFWSLAPGESLGIQIRSFSVNPRGKYDAP